VPMPNVVAAGFAAGTSRAHTCQKPRGKWHFLNTVRSVPSRPGRLAGVLWRSSARLQLPIIGILRVASACHVFSTCSGLGRGATVLPPDTAITSMTFGLCATSGTLVSRNLTYKCGYWPTLWSSF